MTRSIFDPTGGETEQSGSTHLGPAAGNVSHMPPDVIDGEACNASGEDAEERPGPFTPDSAEGARRLGEMTSGGGEAGSSVDEMPPPDGV